MKLSKTDLELIKFAESVAKSNSDIYVDKSLHVGCALLAKSGKIPNELLDTANNLFVNGKPDIHKNLDVLSSVFDLLDVFCEACFLEPTYQEIKDIGLQLTDEQLMFIFNYAQSGVKALEPFREQSKDPQSMYISGAVQG